MAKPRVANVTPKTFFLNERQELSSFDREGGGRQARYKPIDWSARSSGLVRTLREALPQSDKISPDPAGQHHHFVLVVPVEGIEKLSDAKKFRKLGGISKQAPTFGGQQSNLFRKLGMQLLDTLPDGRAAVHIGASRAAQLFSTLELLPKAGAREQGQWIGIREFEVVPPSMKVDASWLDALPKGKPVEVVLRFLPVLTRAEVQVSLQALAVLFRGASARIARLGREFTGRYWCSAFLDKEIIDLVVRDFVSVQRVHEPIFFGQATASVQGAKAPTKRGRLSPRALTAQEIASLPTVAVVDSGIPEQHVHLAPYLRRGYRNPDADPASPFVGDHGSKVASCIVFGRFKVTGEVPNDLQGTCRAMDVMVGKGTQGVDGSALLLALDAIARTAPDVRVFNLSFGSDSLDSYPDVKRREFLQHLQDLEYFAFARDVLLIISAGNSLAGLVPANPYPRHQDDVRWALGALARSFNGVVCGAFVDVLNTDAVAQTIGAPSPFTRIGPGLCGSPVPGFSAPGGDTRADYADCAPASGIWVSDANGVWADQMGTSYSAPLVAREAAWVFQELARYCEPGTLPFSATVRAWLALVARRPLLAGAYEKLAERTLGLGYPLHDRLRNPAPDSAVFVWQAVLEEAKSVARVRFPVPVEWLKTAKAPRLRIVVAWNTPVNAALNDSWACRKVGLKVRPCGSPEALRGGGHSHGAYPLIDRMLDIHPDALKEKMKKVKEAEFLLSDEEWVLEVDYEEVGEYPVGVEVRSQQRVGMVLELFDDSENPASPQALIQALPIATAMNRLSVASVELQSPILVRQ